MNVFSGSIPAARKSKGRVVQKKIPFFLAFIFLALQAPHPLHSQSVQKSRSAGEICKELGAELSWDPFFQSGTFTVRDHRLVFYAGIAGEQGPVLIDGKDLVSVSLPYTAENGGLVFPENFIVPVRQALDRYQTYREPVPSPKESFYRIAAIIIDPGHGGKDSGAVGNHTINGKNLVSMEKNITLEVAKRLYSLLSAAYPGKKVLLTRSGDTYLTLEERVNKAHSVTLKDKEAIIYISVHANASLSKGARGYEIWYLPPETQRELIDRTKYPGEDDAIISIENDLLQDEFVYESIRIGAFILNRFKEALGREIPSRSPALKAENWYVVKNARMPSVLVELGFVTNPDDALLMSGEAYLKKVSEALYKGIGDFVREFESSGGYIAP